MAGVNGVGGGGGGGVAAPKGGDNKAGGDKKAKGADKKDDKEAKEAQKKATIDRLVGMVQNTPLQQMGALRQKLKQACEQQGMKPDEVKNALKKMDIAIIKKLGGTPTANGGVQIKMTPQIQQYLQGIGITPPDNVQQPGQQAPQQPGQAAQAPAAQNPAQQPAKAPAVA